MTRVRCTNERFNPPPVGPIPQCDAETSLTQGSRRPGDADHHVVRAREPARVRGHRGRDHAVPGARRPGQGGIRGRRESQADRERSRRTHAHVRRSLRAVDRRALRRVPGCGRAGDELAAERRSTEDLGHRRHRALLDRSRPGRSAARDRRRAWRGARRQGGERDLRSHGQRERQRATAGGQAVRDLRAVPLRRVAARRRRDRGVSGLLDDPGRDRPPDQDAIDLARARTPGALRGSAAVDGGGHPAPASGRTRSCISRPTSSPGCWSASRQRSRSSERSTS